MNLSFTHKTLKNFSEVKFNVEILWIQFFLGSIINSGLPKKSEIFFNNSGENFWVSIFILSLIFKIIFFSVFFKGELLKSEKFEIFKFCVI